MKMTWINLYQDKYMVARTYSGVESDGCDKINVLKAAEALSPGYVP